MTGSWGLGTGGSLALSFRAKREIFVIRGEGLTLFPHAPRTSPLSSEAFLPDPGNAIKLRKSLAT